MMKRLLMIILAACLVFCSCSPCARLLKRCPPSVAVSDTTYIRDTTVIERYHIDTVVRVEAVRETVCKTVYPQDTAEAATAYASARSWYDGSLLHLELRNADSINVVMQRYYEVVRYSHELERRIEKQTVYQPPERRNVLAVINIVALVLLFAVIFVALMRVK